MGFKKLKAIVAKGTSGVQVAQPAEFWKTITDARQKLIAHPVTGHFRNKGCFACSIGCGRISKVPGGRYKSFGEGPEYESTWVHGASTGVADLEPIIKSNCLCYEFGMDRGGCHVRGYTISPEILGIPEKLDPNTTEGKAQWVKLFQDLTAAVDSAGLCLFTTFAIGADEIAAQLRTATGIDYTVEEVLKAGERIWNLERNYNLNNDFSKADDTLPPRLLKETMKIGPNKGQVVLLDEMLPEYYKLRGWDAEGRPTKAKLEELNL